jgi:carboxymethylenebutenolidase
MNAIFLEKLFIRVRHGLMFAVLTLFGFSIPTATRAGEDTGFIYKSIGEEGKPAIVMAHDWFGESGYYREFAERLAGEGFSVFAMDLYGGKPGGTTHAEAWALLKDMSDAAADRVLDMGIAEAAKVSDTVFTIGFSMGAPFTFRAAIRHADVIDGAIIFYGDPVLDPEELKKLGGPVLAIFGSADGTYGDTKAADIAARLSKAADEAGKLAEIFIFPGAAHAFAQPLFNAGKTYDPVAAETAWTLTMDFIQRLTKP